MEGVSEENNEIYVELTAENLSRALKTAQNARALKVKLTNKHFPCLTVSIELVRRVPGPDGSGCSRASGVAARGRASRACVPLMTLSTHGMWEGFPGRTENAPLTCVLASLLPFILVVPWQVSVSSSSRMVTHDIPVKVIPRKLWKNLQEPTVPDADVSDAAVI